MKVNFLLGLVLFIFVIIEFFCALYDYVALYSIIIPVLIILDALILVFGRIGNNQNNIFLDSLILGERKSRFDNSRKNRK